MAQTLQGYAGKVEFGFVCAEQVRVGQVVYLDEESGKAKLWELGEQPITVARQDYMEGDTIFIPLTPGDAK